MEKTTRRLPIVERDEWLQPVEAQMNLRHERYERKMADIGRSAGSLVDYANGHRYFGWQYDSTLEGWWFREWLPGACDVYLFGDLSLIDFHSDALTSGMAAEKPKFQLLSVPILIDCDWPPMLMRMLCSSIERW